MKPYGEEIPRVVTSRPTRHRRPDSFRVWSRKLSLVAPRRFLSWSPSVVSDIPVGVPGTRHVWN